MNRFPTQIRDEESGEDVDAVIVEAVGDDVASTVDRSWRPYLFETLLAVSRERPDDDIVPEHWHWDWRAKLAEMRASGEEYCFFALEYQGEVQGMMCVTVQASRIAEQPGEKLIYVDYISTAPWNLAGLLGKIGRKPRFRAVGSALLAEAVRFSMRRGYYGRIGLSALPQAETFYRETCRMHDLGIDEREGLQRFEFTDDGARRFIQEG